MRGLLTCIGAVVVFATAGCGVSPEVAKQKGFALYDLGQFEEAHPYLEKAYVGEESDPELVVRLAYCRTAVAGDITGAISILRDSMLRHPEYARTYYQLGYIAYNYGPKEKNANIIQALYFTRKAAELDSTDFKIIDNLGMYHLLLGELDSAMVCFQTAKQIKPDNADLNRRIEMTRGLLKKEAKLDSMMTADTLKLQP